MTTRVTIIGAGRVGRALGTNMIGHGIGVRYLVRRPDEASVPEGAGVGHLEDSVDEGEAVLLALPFGVLPEAVPTLNLPPGCVVIDATNPFGMPLPDGALSGASLVSRLVGEDAEVAKAFNVLGAEHMAAPELPDGSRPLLPVAADDPEVRDQVVALAETLGFDAVDVGGLEAAAVMEEAARYWGLVAIAGNRGRGTVLVAKSRDLPEGAA